VSPRPVDLRQTNMSSVVSSLLHTDEDSPSDVEGTLALDERIVARGEDGVEEDAVEDDPGGDELAPVEVAQSRKLDVPRVLAAVGQRRSAQHAVERCEARRLVAPPVRRSVRGRERPVPRFNVVPQLVPGPQPHLLVPRRHQLAPCERGRRVHVHGVRERVRAVVGLVASGVAMRREPARRLARVGTLAPSTHRAGVERTWVGKVVGGRGDGLTGRVARERRRRVRRVRAALLAHVRGVIPLRRVRARPTRGRVLAEGASRGAHVVVREVGRRRRGGIRVVRVGRGGRVAAAAAITVHGERRGAGGQADSRGEGESFEVCDRYNGWCNDGEDWGAGVDVEGR
jgi:hypothetical protein